MAGQAGFFDVEGRLAEISAKGDDPERLNALVDCELLRSDNEIAAGVQIVGGSRNGVDNDMSLPGRPQ